MYEYNQCIVAPVLRDHRDQEVHMNGRLETAEEPLPDQAIRHQRRTLSALVATAAVGLAVVIASIVIDRKAHAGH